MSVLSDLETEFRAMAGRIKTDSEQLLRQLYSEALLVESKVKQELVLLRQRAANLGTDVDTAAEEAVIEAKKLLAEVLAWIKKIEAKLFGTGSVSDHNTGEAYSER